MVSNQSQSVAIIGGGVSGVLTAIHLLRMAHSPLVIHLVEENPGIGLGVAYSTSFDEHLLNVPASGMSLFEDEPDHFLGWLQHNHQGKYGAEDFVPRKIFGQYVTQVFQQSLNHLPHLVRCRIHPVKATGLVIEHNRRWISLEDGNRIEADQVVLALGNFSPADPIAMEEVWQEKGRYFSNPWNERLYEGVAALQHVLLIGSGLTSLDVVMAFEKLGFTGHFHLISTNGLLPRVHQDFQDHLLSFQEAQLPEQLTALDLYRLFKQELGLARSDWRAVVQAFRPVTTALWRKLPLVEQLKFLRRLAPWWNVHRHRIAPSIANRIEHLRLAGRLSLWKGRVSSVQGMENGLRVEISLKKAPAPITLSVQRLVNCTGPQSDYNRIARHDSLVGDLIRQSLLRPDASRTGMDALPDGRLLGADGTASAYLSTLGPPMKGILFECTSVPEIRQLASQLASRLLANQR